MACNCNNQITTNTRGIPYLASTNVTVSDTTVDIALGWRELPQIGLFFVRLATPIPTGTTATLPVTLTLNGSTRALTLLGGAAATVASIGVGTSGVIGVFNDKFNGILQMVTTVAA
jgi:hypothetical protein